MSGARMPGGFIDDDYWREDDYLAIDVELEGGIPPELETFTPEQQLPYESSEPPTPVIIERAPREYFQSGQKTQSKSRSNAGSATTSRIGTTKAARDDAGPQEIVIAVFGMTGTGKSSFIQKLTGEEVGIGHGLRSHTSNIEEVRFDFGGIRVKLIDTPGFSDTTKSDTEILTMIASWMKDAYAENTKLTGVIYLHRILDPRMTGPSLKNLKMLRSLCGSENLEHVTLATTMWDKVSEEEGESRERELVEDSTFWGKLKDDGARIRRFDYTQGGAMVLINELVQMSPVLLQIQKEVAIEKKTLIQTDAGRAINDEVEKLTKEYEEQLAEVKGELEVAKRAVAAKKAESVAKSEAAARLGEAATQAQKVKEDEQEKKKLEKAEKELKEERDRLTRLLRQSEIDKKALKAPINRKSWLSSSWKCIKCKARLEKVRDEHFDDPTGRCPGCKTLQRFS